MNINIINQIQGLQNAIRLRGRKTSNANCGQVVSSPQHSGGSSAGGRDALQEQSLRIIARVSNLQGQMDNLNVVQDPPFFPIARYQRIDLILKVRRIQEEIGQSSLPPEVKAVSTDKLKKTATDKQIGDAIGKLFAIRHTLATAGHVSAKHAGAGSILTIKA